MTGSLNAAGLIAVAIAVTCAVALVVLTVRRHRTAGRADAAPDGGLDVGWPDPETAPAVLRTRDDRPARTRRGVS